MGSYIPHSEADKILMLKTIGLKCLDELYAVVPPALRLDKLNIPSGMTEIESAATIKDIAAKNKIYRMIFRGAGAYNHYIPSIVKSVTSKEEFVTAYTPYQAEISQGILQSIFEYQTMICELTGMDVSNASVYDGANAAAEAVSMCTDAKRRKVLVSGAAHPMTIDTIKTYCWARGNEFELICDKDGKTDIDSLKELIDDKTACVYIQQPNFYGIIEDAELFSELAHSKGAKYIMGVNPIASAVLKTAGECDADIAVGEGQPLGLPLAFGGPYLGFMACTSAMMRKLPGRIIGETVDADGKRAFVLTLQAREQHIRREKAASNICSNQALCAMTAGAYLTAMGPDGLVDVANTCYSNAHYMSDEICKLKGFELANKNEFFHEFVTRTQVSPKVILERLDKRGILGGLPLPGGILWCATEMNTKRQIYELVGVLKEELSL